MYVVAVATLYRYFPDKNALLRFLVMREANNVAIRVQNIIERSNATTAEALIEKFFGCECLLYCPH